jgi:hypothetical protein
MQIDGDIDMDTDYLQAAVDQIDYIAGALRDRGTEFGDLDGFADQLESAIDQICNAVRVDPVAHGLPAAETEMVPVVFRPQRMTSGG